MTPDPRFYRKSVEVTYNEYCLLIHLHWLIALLPFETQRHLGPRPSNRLAFVSGVSHDTAERAICYFKNENGFEDDPPPHPVVHSPNKGRALKTLELSYMGNPISIVKDRNAIGATSTSTTIQRPLKDQYRTSVSKDTFVTDTLIYDLVQTGPRYGKGYCLNKGHDSETNVKYRAKYVQERLKNIQIVNEKRAPKDPEGFLDESYVNVNHSLSDKVRAKFVEDCIIDWPAQGGPRSDYQENGSRERGRPSKDQKLWRTLPPMVKETRTVPENHDYYHETLFSVHCKLNDIFATIPEDTSLST
ncbi:hypothetical protein BG011_004848 [Mortierella polycephala]|uniref:Uncharacterized protein n=1 Tax=Mortierella polycephala TaxID=41804 RepID=A0A9P6PZD5_9FUNG|nr:hypothetical protein BG011_004848 [Mortierella polycephala]